MAEVIEGQRTITQRIFSTGLFVSFLIALVLCALLREHEVRHDLRIVLLGMPGAGKSATGNTILGKEAFKVDASPVSVTKECQSANIVLDGTNITVIDTPGVLSEMKVKALKCVDISRPHVLVLAIRLGRFTEEERNAVKWIQESFGSWAPNFTIVLFTHIDQLDGKPIESFLKSSPDLQGLISNFGGGYHVFNNKDKDNIGQVNQLLKKIDTLSYDNWGYYYMEEAERKVRGEEQRKREEAERKIRAEEQRKREEAERKIRAEEQRKREEAERKVRAEEQRKREEAERKVRAEEQRKREEAERKMPALDAIKGTMKFHQVISISPGQIKYRDISCLCKKDSGILD
ncbi:GTPase IMAP family member 9-like [Salvelinus alpinus]